MTSTSQPVEHAGDYSYDMAHEEVRPTHGDGDPTAHSAPVSVTTQTPGDAIGDYSYDMAHDIPPQDA